MRFFVFARRGQFPREPFSISTWLFFVGELQNDGDDEVRNCSKIARETDKINEGKKCSSSSGVLPEGTGNNERSKKTFDDD